MPQRSNGERDVQRGALPSDTAAFDALTFDCYGTLIDWRRGERMAIEAQPSLASLDVEQLVTDRHRIDVELIQGPYAPYSDVLRRSLTAAAGLQGATPDSSELDAFAASMRHWPPFEESHACLLRLASRYRLAILSNVEDDTLVASVEALDAPFVELVTAEQLSSYKPARAHFDAALERLGLPVERVLHIAQSLAHDHVPALALGWRTVFVNRLDEPVPADLRPELVVPNLTALCTSLGV